jgi:hypothetical protein
MSNLKNMRLRSPAHGRCGNLNRDNRNLEIVAELPRQFQPEFRLEFAYRNLFHMIRFAEALPDL